MIGEIIWILALCQYQICLQFVKKKHGILYDYGCIMSYESYNILSMLETDKYYFPTCSWTNLLLRTLELDSKVNLKIMKHE